MDCAEFALNLIPIDRGRLPLTCAFYVSVRGRAIWPVADEPDHPLEIQLDDLFAHLVEFWKPLLLRQTYPLSLSLARPSELARVVTKVWEEKPQDRIDEEASEIDAFEDAHNIAHAFGGYFDLPPLWLVREADVMLVDTVRLLERVPFEAVLAELTRVGDEIAAHLEAVNPEKWDRVVAAWHQRAAGDELNLLTWSASLENKVAKQLVVQGLLQPPKNFSEAANDDDELLIAARMAGALPPDQIVQILTLARAFDKHDAFPLDALSQKVTRHLIENCGKMKPFTQGEEIATIVRQWLKLGPSEPVDIFAVAANLGVELRSEAVDPATFDGLAIAGPKHGPGAFINRRGRRIKDSDNLAADAAARITLSHELCHLLVDRSHPLSAVEVLRSRMPASIEARARSFAGEFLLPKFAAADLWDRSGSPVESKALEGVLQELAETYGVSFSVAAWKLEHGAGEPNSLLSAHLDILAPFR